MTLKTISLRDEAEQEAARLRAARARTQIGDAPLLAQLDEDGPWILASPRRRLRERLRGRALFVWRVVCEDACGAAAESHLVGLTARFASSFPVLRAERDAWLAAIAAALRPDVDVAALTWRASALENARRFSRARITRERAIAAIQRADPGASLAFQVGLFDRRAERHRRCTQASGASALHAHAERLATVERAATLTSRPARLVLVVLR
jgi:hypothetical protein